jgi:hypothetical protein
MSPIPQPLIVEPEDNDGLVGGDDCESVLENGGENHEASRIS